MFFFDFKFIIFTRGYYFIAVFALQRQYESAKGTYQSRTPLTLPFYTIQ